MIRSALVAIVLFFATATGASAEVVRQIDWQDLVPVLPPVEDPFRLLTPEQRADIKFIAKVRAADRDGLITDDNRMLLEEAERLAGAMAAQGYDLEELMVEFDKFQAEITRRNALVVGQLEGQRIRLPGYALPLEYGAGGVREFMLVPYVGACIHVPPPPPNQMVFVQLSEAYEVSELFEPVWVTGRMSVQGANRSVGVFDGSISVTTGYTMTHTAVEPYSE